MALVHADAFDDKDVVMVYIAVLVNPTVRALAPEKPAAGIVWGAVFVLSIIPVSKNFSIKDRPQRRQEARLRHLRLRAR